MAQQGNQPDQERFCCSICLDRLKEPVTILCGHSYCMNCIKTYWDDEHQQKTHSCPQCRQIFTQRPVLMKNTMLADLLEELTKTGLPAAPHPHCYAGPGDVSCGFCSQRRLKERRNQENNCCRHQEVMKMFCRTDQQCICYLCSVDQHKGHDTVSAAAERTERQRELEGRQRKLHQRIQDREKEVKLLQQEVEDINHSADRAVEDSEKIFTELIRLMEKRSSDVKQQIRSQQETEVSGVKELQEKLEQEIRDLKRRDAELEQLSHTEDHSQFLQSYPSLPALGQSTHSSSINIRPLRHFKDMTAAVSELRDKLLDNLGETWTKISLSVTEADILLKLTSLQLDLKTRTGFLHHSRGISLDPNTAHTYLLLSEGSRKATLMSKAQSYSSQADRFTYWQQVLSRQSLTGRCYWEVEWRGTGVYVAVSYKNIHREGGANECGFGRNDKSWALLCYINTYTFLYNNIQSPVSGPQSSRVGVFLDHSAGVLSFYSVSKTMTLLHRVQTTFSQPLHAGVLLIHTGDTAEFCKVHRSHVK